MEQGFVAVNHFVDGIVVEKRAACPIAARSELSSGSFGRAAASDFSSPTGAVKPWTPSSINCKFAGIALTTEGNPTDMASSNEQENPSLEEARAKTPAVPVSGISLAVCRAMIRRAVTRATRRTSVAAVRCLRQKKKPRARPREPAPWRCVGA